MYSAIEVVSDMKKRVLCIPTPKHIEYVFSKETLRRLKEEFDVVINKLDIDFTSEEVAEKIRGFDALITGWGSPPLTEHVFENADRLEIVAHSAGSIKRLMLKILFNVTSYPEG